MPNPSAIPNILANYQTRYPEVYIDRLITNEITIGIDVKTYDGEVFVPHSGCKNKSDIERVIKHINEVPFLGRLYTLKTANILYERMIENGIPREEIIDINATFSDVRNLSMDKVRQICISYLEYLKEQSEENITKICDIKITDDDVIPVMDIDEDLPTPSSSSSPKEDDLFEAEEEKKKPEVKINKEVNFGNLWGSDAIKYQNMNLIATRNPLQFSYENFKAYLNKIKVKYPEGFKSISDKYEKEINEYQDKYREWEDKCEKRLDQISENKKKQGKFGAEGERLSSRDDATLPPEPVRPTFEFAPRYQINTLNHWRVIHHQDTKPKYQFRSALLFSDDLIKELLGCSVDDDLMLLLCCGIGVVDREAIKCRNYQTLVAKLATNNKLTYLITDSSICYGTNYPISRVFVTDDFSDAHSSNTLFQLLGRSGRVGKSWKAEGYISDKIAKKLQNFIHNPDDKSALIEANNMDNTFMQLINEKNEKDLKDYNMAKEKQERMRKEKEANEAALMRSVEIQKQKQQSLQSTHEPFAKESKSNVLKSSIFSRIKQEEESKAAQPVYNFSQDKIEAARAKRLADLKRQEEEAAATRRSSPIELGIPENSNCIRPETVRPNPPFKAPPARIITSDIEDQKPSLSTTPSVSIDRTRLQQARERATAAKKEEKPNLSWRRN
jgi:hypothetical protein